MFLKLKIFVFLQFHNLAYYTPSRKEITMRIIYGFFDIFTHIAQKYGCKKVLLFLHPYVITFYRTA